MSKLMPYHVVDDVVKRLDSNKFEFIHDDKYRVSTVAEIASEPVKDGKQLLAPPWLGVFYSLNDEADIMHDGSPYDIPVTIGVLSSSTPQHVSDKAALREALTYAYKTIEFVIGEYVINLGTEAEPNEHLVFLKAQPIPIEIMQADANLSLVVTRFTYYDKFC